MTQQLSRDLATNAGLAPGNDSDLSGQIRGIGKLKVSVGEDAR
jgi:hypothetical protein